jgi:hypothetical protein
VLAQKEAAEHQVRLPWKVDLNDAAFRVIAQIPMQWRAVTVPQNGFSFELEDFMCRVGEA